MIDAGSRASVEHMFDHRQEQSGDAFSGGATDGHAVGGPQDWSVTRARSVDHELDALLDQVAALEASTASMLDPERICARAIGLTALVAAADAARLDALSVLEPSRAWEADGSATAAGWLAHHTPIDRSDAVADLRNAKRFGHCPLVAVALAEGRITGRAARLLAAAAADDPTSFADLEDAFLAVAEAGRLRDLRRVVDQWRDMVKPAPPGADPYAEHVAKRRFSLSLTLDGVGYTNGRLAPIPAAEVAAAIEARAEKLRREDLAAYEHACQLAREQGLPTPVLDPTTLRTATQRRADAFVELLLAGAEALADPRHERHTPRCATRVTVRCDAPDLLRIGNTGDAGEPADLVPVTLGDAAVLLPRHTLEALTCDATVQRVLLDPDSLPLDVGRLVRTVTQAQRAAITERDHTCIFPGCATPVSRCHIHHVCSWTRGGPTDVANLVPLCSRHHHIVHGPNGWDVHVAADGRPTVTHNGRPQPRNAAPVRLRDLYQRGRPPDG